MAKNTQKRGVSDRRASSVGKSSSASSTRTVDTSLPPELTRPSPAQTTESRSNVVSGVNSDARTTVGNGQVAEEPEEPQPRRRRRSSKA